MRISIKSKENLSEIVLDFAYGKVKKVMFKDYENNKFIFKKHGFKFIISKSYFVVTCYVIKEKDKSE